jgi:hypothetical protein
MAAKRHGGVLAAMLLALAMPFALAHGDREPRHGGLLSIGGEISFELVRKADALVIYVDDHGAPVPTDGATGTLEVRSGGDVRTVPVKAAGGNALSAPFVETRTGDRLLLRAQIGAGAMLNGRFAIP